MYAQWLKSGSLIKALLLAVLMAGLAACSVNPATGDRQFAALMSPQQELQAGMQEHEKIMAAYGMPPDSEALQAYVSRVGQRVSQYTERPDVQYKFYVLDDPMVNAFALPGGYVYVTRGLLAQADSEAELAAVLGHEVGHITGRHSAERYSRGVVTSLGAMILSAALDSQVASQALGVGSDLFLKSYSRGQEREADMLGIRYLARAGYDPRGMTMFLNNLNDYMALEARMNGAAEPEIDWFSTHPLTASRVAETVELAAQYPQGGAVERDAYLNAIDGMIYGESPRHGFIRGTRFYHPEIGVTFEAPAGFKLVNQPEQVVASDNKGTIIIFDAAPNPQGLEPLAYLSRAWLKGEAPPDAEAITISGMPAATASFTGQVGNSRALIRVVAVRWSPTSVFRFQMAMPQDAPAILTEDLKRTTYSLRPMSAEEKRNVQPYRVRIITAAAGDTAASLARRMPFTTYQEERFRSLNALRPGEQIVAGRRYKITVE